MVWEAKWEGNDEETKGDSPKDRELGYIPLDPLVHVIDLHPIMVKSTKEVPILFFRGDLALGRRVVELELLHGVLNRLDRDNEQVLEVLSLGAFRLSLLEPSLDAGIFWWERRDQHWRWEKGDAMLTRKMIPVVSEGSVVRLDFVEGLITNFVGVDFNVLAPSVTKDQFLVRTGQRVRRTYHP
jgi:hypothetical protein